MKINNKIAKIPQDLDDLSFVKLKPIMRKELLRLKKYTSAEKPTQCIILGSHDYTDKKDMLLILFGKWKGPFKTYAKREAIKKPLGAIGSIYFDGIEEETQKEVFQINLAKGKGKKASDKLQKKLKRLIPQSTYHFIFKEISEQELEQLEQQLEQMPEEETIEVEELSNAPTPPLGAAESSNIEKLAVKITEEATTITNKVAGLFDTAKKPSLKPLLPLINLSKKFWASLSTAAEEEQSSLKNQVYATYAQLEEALYNYWKSSPTLDEEYAGFILDKVYAVFKKFFEGSNNKGHQKYGTGLKVANLAKNYNAYQAIHEIDIEVKVLSDKYGKDKGVQAEMKELGNAVQDTKILLKSGQKLNLLIKEHYKNAELREQLLLALSGWEEARTTMMDEMIPYIRGYYDVIQITLTESETAKAIKIQATQLLKDLSNMQALVQKFEKMDAFRQKIKQLDTNNVLSKELQAMQQAEEQLKNFALEMKQKTATWINQYVDLLVQADEDLIASNQTTQLEQAKLQELLDKLQQQTDAATVAEVNTFWEQHPKEKELLQDYYGSFQEALEENSAKRAQLNLQFYSAYEYFSTLNQ